MDEADSIEQIPTTGKPLDWKLIFAFLSIAGAVLKLITWMFMAES